MKQYLLSASRLGLILVLSSGLAGCSYLSSLFPDKQKQYRYSTEIPPLEIPPNMHASTIQGIKPTRQANPYGDEQSAPSPSIRADDYDVTTTPPPVAQERTQTPSPEPERLVEQPDEADAVVDSGRYILAESSDGTPLIEINEPYPAAWNTVGRALARLKMKISDQNRSDGLYYVRYGERDDTTPEDHGLLSDLMGYITGRSRGEEYRIRVEERGKITYVMAVDDKNVPVSEGKGVELLKRLHQGLEKLSSGERERGDQDDDEEDRP